MKKSFYIITLIFSLIALRAANAGETKGVYISLYGIGSDMMPQSTTLSDGTVVENNDMYAIDAERRASAGGDIHYSFNVAGFFFSPGIYYNYYNIDSKDKNNNIWSMLYSYGVTADIGYDIMEHVSVYGIASYGETFYNVNFKRTSNEEVSDSDLAPAFGFGISMQFIKDIDLDIEYTQSELKMKDPDNNVTEFQVYSVMAGLSFNF